MFWNFIFFCDQFVFSYCSRNYTTLLYLRVLNALKCEHNLNKLYRFQFRLTIWPDTESISSFHSRIQCFFFALISHICSSILKMPTFWMNERNIKNKWKRNSKIAKKTNGLVIGLRDREVMNKTEGDGEDAHAHTCICKLSYMNTNMCVCVCANHSVN